MAADKGKKQTGAGGKRASAAPRSGAAKKRHAATIIERLREAYPDAHIVLSFGNDWELLVAVILSAQCTDKMVNQVTARLFQKYRTIEDYAGRPGRSSRPTSAPPGSSATRPSTSSARRRRSWPTTAGRCRRAWPSCSPCPGVARKTANIVLGNAHPEAYATDPDAGIAVDTHVTPAQPDGWASPPPPTR